MTSISKPPLEGIGGWLAVLTIVQVLSTLKVLAGFAVIYQYYDPVTNTPAADVVVFGELALNAALFALMAATTIAIFKRKRAFLTLLLWQWIAIPVVPLLDAALVSTAFDLPFFPLAKHLMTAQALAPFLWTGLSVWYTQKSERVANTMVN
jgi:hypothetical protein